MKLNLDINLVNLKGEPMEEKLSDVLANMLATSNKGKPAKMIAWAVKLVNEGEIDIDKSDAKFLLDFIEHNELYTNLPKAQLMEELEKMKD